MKNIEYNHPADLNFDRFSFAANSKEGVQATSMWTLCRYKQKPFLARIPLISTVKQCSLPSGFFTSAASDAIDNVPEWVSCTGYTGHIAPYASLANLVKVLHNLPALSGITDRMRSKLTRSAHLLISKIQKDIMEKEA